jgi:D-alanyl-D-alanine carboxypeptidase
MMTVSCGKQNYEMPYTPDAGVSSFNVFAAMQPGLAPAFGADLCIVTKNIMPQSVNMEEASAALLCDLKNKTVLYAKNANEQLYPASLTKMMTALVALKYGSLDQRLTATESVKITESGAQLCGLKPGDTMTMDQALHILLLYSANDVAMLIAENVGGTVEHFIDLMNEEALKLGATNTHFANPHGLTDENHYTTAYDLYLMFQETVSYEVIKEIIHMSSYQTVYYDGNGKTIDFSSKTTNLFLQGVYTPPGQVTVIGGKTGTTNAAGHCLMILSKDTEGNSYISVILKSSSRDVLYGEMHDLLQEIAE